MEYTFLTKDGDFKFSCSTEAPESLRIHDSTLTIRVDTPAETFEAYCQSTDNNAQNIQEGDRILFKYNEKMREMIIMELEIDNGECWIYAENTVMELADEDTQPLSKPVNAQPIEYYLKPVLSGSEIIVGVNEVSDQKRQLEYTGTSDKKITRLIDILNAFDAEAEFALETKNYGTVKIEARYLNIYKRRGDGIVSDHLQDEINITNVEMNRSIKDLRTAINLTGKQIEGTENQYTTIAGLEYDDGEYFSPIGNPILYSRKAMDKWLPVRQYDKGLVMNWTYDTDNASELLQRGKNELQKYDDVKVSYTVEGVIKGEIGNYVEINTSKLGKPLLLKARIIEQEICLEDETKNKNIIGEYIIGTDETNETYKLMQEILNNTVVSAVVNAQYEHMVNNVLDNQMRCILYAANSKEVDVEENYLYKWRFSFCDQNGIQIKAITKTGKNIVLQNAEWPENAASVNYEVEWEAR